MRAKKLKPGAVAGGRASGCVQSGPTARSQTNPDRLTFQPDGTEHPRCGGAAHKAAKRDASLAAHRNGFDGAASIRNDKGADEGVTLDDFYAYMPMHNYIFAPTRETWPATSVNSRIPPIPVIGEDERPVIDDQRKSKQISAAAWLDRHHPVEQMTWAPGSQMLIRHRLISDGGWIERNGVTTFNLYRPPIIVPGNAGKAGPWIDHVRMVYGADAEHIIRWLAHRVQHPQSLTQ